MPPPGLDALKHIVVLMMENRSFDHMLGGLKARCRPADRRPDRRRDQPGHDGKARAGQAAGRSTRGSSIPDPDHHFAAVDKQIFDGGMAPTLPTMGGFVKSYFDQRRDVAHSRKIMYYFKPDGCRC